VNDAVIVPMSTVHVGACNRAAGVAEIAQVVSLVAKLAPETETTVPKAPELGVNVIDGSGGKVNFALEITPLGVLVICTAYTPPAAVGEITNIPASEPPETVHV